MRKEYLELFYNVSKMNNNRDRGNRQKTEREDSIGFSDIYEEGKKECK